MYAKLVLRNAKRSVKDYLVYIVTLTICVTLFYSFLVLDVLAILFQDLPGQIETDADSLCHNIK